MSWHYLPVWVDHEHCVEFTLCEVYLDSEGRLKSWTEKPAMTPQGDDLDDLRAMLEQMLQDANRWEPVRHADLKVGMVLKKRSRGEA
ncbi:hypothetical protein [Hyphomicrobium sulfonivorans]|uniref:hypothetical protein n=1 Tax=Hyphomicrobium sulfonivorans TaxID=121290 RepID=UPI00157069F6|nr:hypothetical protein [Hyphomicrobium sulfonivorans]MBI1650124.1 hypothetical protein [Hyphomicrobium sulfonivorans]NSL73039.1 hypothetical protein [Hyphomicrobium sulfonivorans]